MSERQGICVACATWMACLLVWTGTAQAAPPTIESVRVGLPAGGGGGVTRIGSWAPVAIVLKAGDEGHSPGEYRLSVEAVDADQLKARSHVDVPGMKGGAERLIWAYALPGTEAATVTVRLETAEGQVVNRFATVKPDQAGRAGDNEVVFTMLGTDPSRVRHAPARRDRAEKKDGEDRLAAMPDSWIGYDAADVVVLTTSDRDFVSRLAKDRARCAALREWVLRGGQLVWSVGANRQEAARLLEAMPLIPFRIAGGETLPTLPVLAMQWAKQDASKGAIKDLPIAVLSPGVGVHPLVRDGGHPVLLAGSLGLGRVVVAAFDLDAPGFAGWEGNEAFWLRLQDEIAPQVIRRKADKGRGAGKSGTEEGRQDYRSRLKAGLEKFEDIVPIPFGWVALLILFYIVLVGPVDYFILKRVFKKLELTWITFPLLVLASSLLACWAAFSLKGDEQRVNKVDLVEIDMHGKGQVVGRTWFTVFSPRVQAYRIDLSPAGGEWTGKEEQGAAGTTFSLLEGSERPPSGSQGLFAQPYEFTPGARRIVGVPIPVWSTRSFAASWRAALPRVPPLGITDDLGPPRAFREGRGVSGKLTNNLGVGLRGCTLFYKGRWSTLGDLAPGQSKRLADVFARDAQGQHRDIEAWLDSDILNSKNPQVRPGQRLNASFGESRSTGVTLKHLMFYRAAERPGQTNAGLRQLDQTWRLRRLPEYPPPPEPRYREEAILVARVPLVSDAADLVARHPASPSRLWLGELPESGKQPPALGGTVTQETFIRVYIPVR